MSACITGLGELVDFGLKLIDKRFDGSVRVNRLETGKSGL